METLETIEKRWGCRKYTDDPVSREVLGTILNAGRFAPSAGNLQDRSFIVVKDPELKTEIAKASGNQTWMQSAPIHIVIVADNKKNSKFFGHKGEKIYSIQDTAFSAENMLLAAIELGLGCSLVVGFNEEKMKEILKIEPPAEPYSVITIGHPAEPAKTSTKYPLEKFVFFEKFGNKIADAESAFGDLSKMSSMSSKGMEEGKKKVSGLFSWVKSLFGKKNDVPMMEDHFMEEKPEMKEEIPRQLKR